MHHLGLVILGVLAIIAWILLGPGLAVYLAAAVVGSVLGLVLGIWMDNRLSNEARAKRAVRTGHIGQALRLQKQPPPDLEIDQLLTDSLSPWPDARRALRRAVSELGELRNAVVVGRTAGIPAEIADRLVRETQTALDVLYESADRLGAAAIQYVDLDEIGQDLNREVKKIERLVSSTHAARIGLAKLTLSGERNFEARTQEETAIVQLNALGEAARELAEMENR